jgi:hypothetical protein
VRVCDELPDALPVDAAEGIKQEDRSEGDGDGYRDPFDCARPRALRDLPSSAHRRFTSGVLQGPFGWNRVVHRFPTLLRITTE